MCNTLFTGSNIYLSAYYSTYNRESIPIHLSNVNCSGAESRLVDCFHTDINTTGEDASMRCHPYSNGEINLEYS